MDRRPRGGRSRPEPRSHMLIACLDLSDQDHWMWARAGWAAGPCRRLPPAPMESTAGTRSAGSVARRVLSLTSLTPPPPAPLLNPPPLSTAFPPSHPLAHPAHTPLRQNLKCGALSLPWLVSNGNDSEAPCSGLPPLAPTRTQRVNIVFSGDKPQERKCPGFGGQHWFQARGCQSRTHFPFVCNRDSNWSGSRSPDAENATTGREGRKRPSEGGSERRRTHS